MKKTLAYLLCVLLLLGCFAGCGAQNAGGTAPSPASEPSAQADVQSTDAPETEAPGTDETEAPTEPEAPATVANDTGIAHMRFAAPEGFETVERLVNLRADGTLIEKDITYSFANGTEIGYAYIHGYSTDDVVDVTTAESVECEGKTFYLMERGSSTLYAFADGDGGVYAVSAILPSREDRALFDQAIGCVSFVDDSAPAGNEVLAGVQWSIPEDWTLAGTLSTRKEAPDGTLLTDRITFSFGEELEEPEWRFSIRAYRGALLEDKLDADETYLEQEVNGVVYSVADSYETPYSYYTQQGDDVWWISNSGVFDGLFYSRSEESAEAFAAFLDTIRFVP